MLVWNKKMYMDEKVRKYQLNTKGLHTGKSFSDAVIVLHFLLMTTT